MDIRQIQQIILTKTFTKADYLRRVTIIREYLESRFFKDFQGDFSLYLEKKAVPIKDRKALTHLDGNFFNLITSDNLYLIINGLVESLKDLPTLTLYLAIIVEDDLVNKLGVWFRQNLHPELIMEVRYDPGLVSGCAYVWNNKYHDLSLHHLFNQKHEVINKIIDAYAREQL